MIKKTFFFFPLDGEKLKKKLFLKQGKSLLFFEKFLNENAVGFSRKKQSSVGEWESFAAFSILFFGLSCEMIGDGEQKDPLENVMQNVLCCLAKHTLYSIY